MILSAKFSDGQVYTVTTSSTATIQELKQDIFIKHSAVPVDQMRLVKTGKILTHNESLLTDYDIKEGDIIYVVKSSQSTSQESPQPSTIKPKEPTKDPMLEMLQHPAISALFESPEFMSYLFENDPTYKALVERNPEVAQAMRDPSFLRDISKAVRNPQLMQEMMRNQDRALSNIEAIPGGFTALTSMIGDSLKPVSTPDPSTEEANARMAQALGANITPTNGPNTNALPNPWAPQRRPQSTPNTSMMNPLLQNPMASMMNNPMNNNPMMNNPMMNNPMMNPMMMSQMNPMMNPMMSRATPMANTPSLPMFNTQEFPYGDQLQVLSSMGFTDQEKAKRALLACGGNVETAVSFLLEH